ncbi:hypothetical protein [Streptomyces griseomycini]|uniref:Uncharacterized protein n=1 Tax=Streptomyces griseomycini TaxID=66895 RepID=A0A7W7PUL5_9ACTN|nr:hypothetical protein [Streptomyces griseomycini]MBB4901577.1 hypothetical protein [Streptomyces griseomycini]
MGDALHDVLPAAVHEQAAAFPESVPDTFPLLIEIDLEERFSAIAATTGDHFKTLDQTRPR